MSTISPIEISVALLILAIAWMIFRNGPKNPITKLLLKLFGVFTFSLETSAPEDDPQDLLKEDEDQPAQADLHEEETAADSTQN